MDMNSTLRLLVVEDSDHGALAMAKMLRTFGHEAQIATTGNDALRTAPAFRPDAFFIELMMRRIDGLSMARSLRALPGFKSTPVVAVSDSIDADQRAKVAEAGFDEFLQKSSLLDELPGVLARIRTRVLTSCGVAEQARALALQTRRLVEESHQQLNEFWRNRTAAPVYVSVQKSGIANVITVAERASADELRRRLKEQRCRVGPVFESAAGAYAFFVYSKRHCIRELIGKHGGFQC